MNGCKKVMTTALLCAVMTGTFYPSAQALDLGILGTLAGAAIYYHQLDSTLQKYDTTDREKFFEGLKKKNGVDQDPTRNAMLHTVMTRLSTAVAETEPSIVERPYLYFVNPNEDFNAFCSLGHTMSVNKGVYTALNYNENELAFVVAHEMVHGQKNHVVQGMRKSFPLEVLQAVYGTQNGGTIGVDILTHYASSVYVTKAQEKEADKIAFDYAVRAGYNPGAGAALWQRIIEKMGDNKTNFVGELFAPSDHPENSERRDAYSERLTEFSNGHVTIEKGTIYIDKKEWLHPADTATMSGKERSYLIGGNISAALHHQKKEDCKAYMGADGYLYIGNQPIFIPQPSEENGHDLVRSWNERIDTLKD